MSGLLSLLQNSAQSLQAQQAYSSTVAQNLSNSNTAGYSRQRAEIAAVTPVDRFGNSFIGRGAVLLGVSQARDKFLEMQMPGAFGSQKQSATESQLLQGVSVLDSSNPNGLSPAIANFYAQLRALAQDAGNPSYRQAAVSAATQLTLSFNQAAQSLASARDSVDANLNSRVPEINQQLTRVAELNVQIRTARASGAQPNDLLDARQRAVDALAEATGATIVDNSEGDANLTLADGTALVTGERAGQFSTIGDASNGGHLALKLTAPDGQSTKVLALPPGGELGGMIAARDGGMRTAEQQIDQLAYDLGGAINAVHQGGYALDGTTGRDLFNVSATVTGAARALSVNQAIASDVSLLAAGSSATSGPGDASNLQLIINTESQGLTGGLNATSTLAQIVSTYGATTQRATAVNDGDQALLNHLTSLRQSTSGVSVDEELVNMQKSQRAYEAVTKVIQTANDMLATLMSLK